jgi:hypothetical protein
MTSKPEVVPRGTNLSDAGQKSAWGKLETLLGPAADSEGVMGSQEGMNRAQIRIPLKKGGPLQCEILLSRSGTRCVGRIFDRRGRHLFSLSHPLRGSLFGLKQLLHAHRLVDVVFGAGPAGRVELGQRKLCRWQALFGSFLTDS